MALRDWFKKKEVKLQQANPHASGRVVVRSSGFFSADSGRLLAGWDTQSQNIDHYLSQELASLRARSRRMVRMNPFGKRFIATMKTNIVGPDGVIVQANTMRNGNLDTAANEALEAAFSDWGKNYADVTGRLSWVDMQNMAISCASQDGEFIFRKYFTGPYGYQLRVIDPGHLDASAYITDRSRNLRLGVEYASDGSPSVYHFKDPQTGVKEAVPANQIIHGFINEWPDQSRGIPWMHASLERTKHLEKYEEAAIVKARSTASTMAVVKSQPGEAAFTGSTVVEGEEPLTLQEYEAGTIQDIGDRDIVNLDSDYPHEMYAAFVKTQLQSIASGMGISYHSLSSDLEGVNYSSIRAGVLEDREVFKGLQNWFIRSLVTEVYEDVITFGGVNGKIQVNGRPRGRPLVDYLSANYQARRWAWVDPQKDGNANQMAIQASTRSRSQIIREQGADPETVFREIQAERELMLGLGLNPDALFPGAESDDQDEE